MNDFNCTDGKKPLENGDFNSTFGSSAKKLKKTKKKAKDSSAVQEGAAASRGDENQQQQEKKPPKKARKKVQKKSELLKTGCRVVRLWIAAEMTNEYQTDIVKVWNLGLGLTWVFITNTASCVPPILVFLFTYEFESSGFLCG